MRKLLNTLYITSPDSYLSRDGLNVVVLTDNKERFRIPILNIESIITMGYTGASPSLMRLCSENNVSISFLSNQGKFISRVNGPIKGNVILRMSQFKSTTSKEFTSNLCKIIIAGKIQNYRNILQRYLRDYGANLEVENASERLYKIRNSVLSIEDIDVLRGLEGEAAASYFSVFNFLILNRDNTFLFNGRNKRPPKDPVNAMLSFVYTLLASEVQSALETVGLDPYVGFLHTLRPGRASLALDLMEELRAYMGDRLVLSIINRKQISAKDFVFQDSDNILMTDKTKKEILNSWQKRKQDIITHPYLNEQIPIGLLPYTQALLLARYLRGDLDNYPVFISK